MPDLRRFTAKLSDGCWNWLGATTPLGYGLISNGGRMVYVHRFAYEALVGPIPDGYELDHLCRNRACARPDHLEPVSHLTNMQRGSGQRHPVTARAANRHCRKGHWLDEANTYNDSRGRSRCRPCAAERMRQKRAVPA